MMREAVAVMAEGRWLLKSLSTSRRYAKLQQVGGPLADFACALYPLLLAHADDDGTLEGDAFTVKTRVCPTSAHSEAEVEQALVALAEVQLIARTVANDRARLTIVDFVQRQARFGPSTESPSPFPPVPPLPPPHEIHGGEIFAELARHGGHVGGGGRVREGGGGGISGLPAHALKSWTRLLRGPKAYAAFDGPRVWVPSRLHEEFVALRNHAGAEDELFAWYEQVSDAFTTGDRREEDTGTDMWRFWRERYDERWPVTRAPLPPRPKAKPTW